MQGTSGHTVSTGCAVVNQYGQYPGTFLKPIGPIGQVVLPPRPSRNALARFHGQEEGQPELARQQSETANSQTVRELEREGQKLIWVILGGLY